MINLPYYAAGEIIDLIKASFGLVGLILLIVVISGFAIPYVRPNDPQIVEIINENKDV